MTELLVINNLSVKLQNKIILDDVNLRLTTGDILGLVGPSGCGKTTLLNTLAGFIAQTYGEITLNIGEHQKQQKLLITVNEMIAPEHRNIGMIFQDYALFPHLTVEQNILFGIDKLSKTEQQLRLSSLIKLLKLDNLEQRFSHQLSGGQQQRVAIARALARQPKLLLLDEPFSNIDARLRKELMLEMRKLLKQLKISAIFVTHNKDEVFTFADQMAVMAEGKILQVGSPLQVCQQPKTWQVADFLQLGTCIPLQKIEYGNNGKTKVQSALGCINVDNDVLFAGKNTELLLKPQFIELCLNNSQEKNNNAQVDDVVITEQGYHYLLSSLTNNSELAFKYVSFYSEVLLERGQQITIQIKPHQYIIFHPK